MDADLQRTLAVARGDEPADLLLRGGQLVNVLSGEIHRADVAVLGDRVVGVGAGYRARETVDCSGRWIAPGLTDGHMHVESSLVTLPEFARCVVPRGTTAVVLDPHEIANVHGVEGIRYILRSREGLPLHAFVMLPSCVPATHLETSGAELDAAALAPLFDEPGVLGLAEVMNVPGLVGGDPGVVRKVAAARRADAVIDGHAPGLGGQPLNAYAAAGVGSDHESTELEEAREKLRRGLRVMIREGSAARNLADLLPLVTAANAARCCLVTDDRHPHDLLDEGHVDHAVREAIRQGLEPVLAYRLATLSPAEWFRLDRRGHGAVAPGWRADLLVLGELEAVRPERVYLGGRLVARDGELVVDLPQAGASTLPPSVRVDLEAFPGFRIPAEGRRARIIEIVPGQLLTRQAVEAAPVEDGEVVADPERDLLKLAVVERHGRGGGVGLGLVRGLGMRAGAVAGSVAHDHHNLVVAGTSDADMRRAMEAVVEAGGGLAVVAGDRLREVLPLPVAGLMSDRPLVEVRAGLDRLHAAYAELGGGLASPFMALSFLGLAVIPSLKLTDLGLVDVERFERVELWVD